MKAAKAAPRELRFSFETAELGPLLVKWYRANARPLPWRVLWRRHQDPYHVWVSEIMLQQTVIKAVLPVYDRFLKTYPSVAELAAADDESVRRAVRGLGYYRRFRMMHAAAQVLAEAKCWPKSFDAWLELPGIGDYTAAAISSIAFSYPAAVVDGNVERVFCRLLDLREAPNQPELKRAFKKLASEFLVADAAGDFNQGLMELGQTVCTTSAAPACGRCPLSSGCLSFRRGSQALAPAAKAKPEMIDVALKLLIVRGDQGIALVQRPDSARFLKGSWGFFADADSLPLAGSPRRLGAVKHNITRHKIEASVETAILQPGARAKQDLRWLAPGAVEENLVSNLDRKAWRLYQNQGW